MRFNWRRALLAFVILEAVVFVAGCTATWLGAISALLPALEAAVNAVISLVVGLEGKTVPATVSAAVQKIGANIATEIANVKAIIAAASSTAGATVAQQIQAAFMAIQSNLASILSGFDVTDSSTVTKVTGLVGIAVSAVQSILALIPLMLARLSGANPPSDAELIETDKLATQGVNHIHEGLKQAYHVVRDTETASADVNTALASLPTGLP